MKRYTVGGLVLGGFGAAVAVIGLMLVLAWHGMMQSEQTAEQVDHAHEARIAIEQIMAEMHGAVASQRGFLLSGDDRFLGSRDAALLAMQDALSRATMLTGQDADQQARLKLVRELAERRTKQLQLSQTYYDTQGLEGALRQVGTGGTLEAQMRDVVHQTVFEQQRQLQRGRDAEIRRMETTRASIAFLLTLVLFFLTLRIRRDIRQQDEAGAALRQSEATLKQILDLMPVGVHVTNGRGVPLMVNPTGHRIWAGTQHTGMEQYGQYKANWLDSGHPLKDHEWGLARALKDGEISCNEALEIECFDGSTKIVLNSAMPLRDAEQKIVGAVVVSQEVTELKRTEQSLRKAHDELELRVQQRTAELEQTNQLFRDEIAERKWAEEALQQSQKVLRHFYTQQEYIKEEERKRIAREIHDELGQNLLALRIDISMLFARTGERHPRLNQKVARVLENVDSTVKSVRSIINNLRPAVLDLGLYAAIEWQVNEFKWRTGILCSIECTQKCHEFDSDLDDNRATGLFRILQESLANVTRHAQASRVTVILHREGTRFTMKIADNGVGIQPGAHKKENSFGLVGIEERVNALGGQFLLESAPGTGTALCISLPVQEWRGVGERDFEYAE
jgi:PAS domain S-box-containing protein